MEERRKKSAILISLLLSLISSSNPAESHFFGPNSDLGEDTYYATDRLDSSAAPVLEELFGISSPSRDTANGYLIDQDVARSRPVVDYNHLADALQSTRMNDYILGKITSEDNDEDNRNFNYESENQHTSDDDASDNEDNDAISGPVNDPVDFFDRISGVAVDDENLINGSKQTDNLVSIYPSDMITKNKYVLEKAIENKKNSEDSDERTPASYEQPDKLNRDDMSTSHYGNFEYIDHPLVLMGHQYMQGGAGEGRQLLGPDGTFENVQVIKTDRAVPSYCDPPNPCPLGYTAEDGCLENFVNSASFSREYQAKQQCSCDNEHSLFNCASPVSTDKSQLYSSVEPSYQSSGQDDSDGGREEVHSDGELDILARAIQNRFESVRN